MTEREERQVEEMDERAERLEDDVEEAREDWERKKRDSSVPGAAGDPEAAESGSQPEQNYPRRATRRSASPGAR
jgi:hypothetical protein